MRCPQCNAETSVLETRDGSRRRRKCENDHRFTTMEVVIPEEVRLTGYGARLRNGMAELAKQKEERRRMIGQATGTLAEVAKQYGCSPSHVWDCRRLFAADTAKGKP